MVYKPQNRSRGVATLVWVVLNGLRLAGVVAIIWAAAIHCVLFSKDISQALQAQKGPLNAAVGSTGNPAGISGPLEGINKQATSDSAVSVTYLTMGPSLAVAPSIASLSSPAPSQASGNVPSVLFPNAVAATDPNGVSGPAPTQTPIDMAETPAAPSAISAGIVAAGFHVKARSAATDEGSTRHVRRDGIDQSTNRGGVEVNIDVTDGRYYPQTTVPIQSGGLISAIAHRLLSVIILGLLLMFELGVPEIFLINNFSAFSMISSPFWLGFAKVWMGIDMQRHYVPSNFLYPGMLLVGLGLVQTHLALPLIWNQRRINRSYPTLKSREIHLKFNQLSRLPFWKPVPELAYQRAYDTSGMAAMNGGGSMHEKRGSVGSNFSGRDGDEDEYPTFSGGALTDPESQIQKLTRRQHEASGSWDGESQPLSAIDEEEEEEEEEEMLEVTKRPTDEAIRAYERENRMSGYTPSKLRPPGQEEMTQIPSALQGMVTGAQTRFAVDQVPTIKLQPSTPSTIASGKRSIKHPGRPDSMFSTNTASTTSFSGSSQTRRMTLVKEAANVFPTPPDRAAIPARAKPKAHLVKPKVDESRLVPPSARNGHGRKHSGGSQSVDAGRGILKGNKPVEGGRPPPRRSASNEEIGTRGIELMHPRPARHPEQEDLNKWEIPKRPMSAMMKTREDTEDREDARRMTSATARRSVRFDCNKDNRASVDSAVSSDNDTGFDLSDILPKRQHQHQPQHPNNPFEDTQPYSQHPNQGQDTYSGDESAGYVPEMPDHPFSRSHRRGDSDTVSRSSRKRQNRRKSHMVV